MKIVCCIIIGIFLSFPSAFGASITPELAKDAAGTQLEALERSEALMRPEILKGYREGLSTRSISEIRPLLNEQGHTLAYVMVLEPKGYIVVSPDTDIRPVIAYSMDNEFPFEETPDNVLLHLVVWDMENRLNALPLLSEEHKGKNRLLWEQYLAKDQGMVEQISQTQQWGPYITTQWHQGNPYNKYCPMDPDTGNRCVVGCTATAMAQIIGYWKYPSSVSFDDNDRYETSTRSIKIDEDHDLYDFPSFEELNQMLSEIDYDYEDNIAALNFAVGISVHMNYTSSGSNAGSSASAFIEKFGYANASYLDPSSDEFYDVLEKDMKEGRPASLSIRKEGAGHAIVADGFKETGEYHLNFGWGGTYNDWYFLPEGMPGGYNTVGYAIVKIYPEGFGPPSKATNPGPDNEETGVSINKNLSWSDGGGATSFNVYFGTDSTPDIGELKGNQTSFSYNPGTLDYSTTYYWRIDAKNSYGTTTGDVWYFTTATDTSDDPYEENDTMATAYDISDYEGTWLSCISGLGVQKDEDWYRIYVTHGNERVLVDCQFTHADGDIDLKLYNSSGSQVAGSTDTVDNEYIDYTVPGPGTYYIKVYHGDAGNTYDLWWDDIAPPDTTPPDTSITGGPSGTITYNDVTFTYTGSDNVTSTSNLVYSYKLDSYDSGWSSYTSSTSKSYNDLPNGSYTFYVKAKDEAGNVDPSPASRSFTVNVSSNHAPELTSGDVDPDSGNTSTTFSYTVHYYDQDGDSPSTRYVYIDGSPHVMSKYSGSVSNGTYRYQTTLSTGSYNYYFYFADGNGGSDRLPSSETYSGPLVDSSKPTVTVTATDSTASEPGSNTGKYRISRTGSTALSLPVYFAMSGSATNGTDYNTISSPKTISAGSSYLDVTLTPKDDSIYEGNETAVLTISTNSAYDRGSPYSATVTIQDIHCTYSIDPTSEHFSSSGGTGSVNVTAESGCDWTATSNDGWITIISGSGGSGNGTVNYSVSSNSSTGFRIIRFLQIQARVSEREA
jgi:hypothetical protein